MTNTKARFTVHLRSDCGSLFGAAREATTDAARREYLREEILSGFQRDTDDPDDDSGHCTIDCRDIRDLYAVLAMAQRLGVRPSLWASTETESVRASVGLLYDHAERNSECHGEIRITNPTPDSARVLGLIEAAKTTLREIADAVRKPA